MVLFIGYVASALGPVIGGAVKNATGSFDSALAILPALGLVMMFCALAAPKPRRPSQTSTHELERA